jgi:hypothetical protein
MITNIYGTYIDQLINDYQAYFRNSHNSIKTHTTIIYHKKNIIAKAAKFIIYQNFFRNLI